ncbi:hypothetical protein KS18_03775 [Photorhabdus luminescens]|nr:hypothetical protein KS18_03775 [Photorhabdus luminescens]
MPIFKIGIFVLIQDDGYTEDFYVCSVKLKQARLEQQSPEHETMLMTIAEQLEQKGREQGRTEGRAEGRKEGRVEGRAEGRVKGREEGKLETACALLRHGVSLDIIVTSTGLSRDKIEALKH